ncbi:hypothetical protein [Oleiagrimonas sp. MCCC 1A03011]|uniref:hypothetical protein n=1 Tax=Oleiagrimonas sp. MCCC 1A03011 TaxID=1926883 RepID=UPI000DC21EE1|nr:hypothetical protein [Oleiagrimonas sp. MCCC 1A03011]RAP55705.1 hypothetical protein BTJ49_14865 [Oleiagrimonas sp. MCCC 1A03011]
MRKRSDNLHSDAWYAQPVLWLGMAIFAGLMAGCVWVVVVSLRHDETPKHGSHHAILGVPVSTRSSSPPAS